MMTQPLTGHTNRHCRRFRANMATDSFSAALVSLVLKSKNAKKVHTGMADKWVGRRVRKDMSKRMDGDR